MIVPFPPGGTTDVVARLVAQGVTGLWGQSVVIDNKSGASGMIGAAEGARAAPDGYTVTIGNNQTHATNATLFKNPQFDIVNGVAPIAMIAKTKHVLVVPESSSITSYQEFIREGKKRALNYGVSSVGSSSHILAESIARSAGINAKAIPYRGAAPVITDLMGGQLDYTFASYGSAANFIQSKKLRALAISGNKREPDLPNVPTFDELGVKAASLESWIGLYAPVNTPEPILQAWSDAIKRIVGEPQVVSQLKTAGFEVYYKSRDEMKTFHPEEVQRWAKEIKASHISLD